MQILCKGFLFFFFRIKPIYCENAHSLINKYITNILTDLFLYNLLTENYLHNYFKRNNIFK